MENKTKSRKKICQILFAGLGGHGSVVFSLIGADKSKKWSNSLLFYGNQPVKPEYVEYCEKDNIPFDNVLKKPDIGITAYVQAYQCLKKQRPEIILLHVPTLILVAWWYCFLHRAKLIMIEHNANQIKRKSEWICSLLGILLSYKIVYLTTEYANEIKKKIGLFYLRKKVSIIPNGIDLSLFYPKQNLRENNKLVISMIARFSFSKDHHTLVYAFDLLQQENREYELYLHLAGEGETMPGIKKLVSDLKVPNVIFPGILNENEVALLTRETDIYVLATTGETMSTSIIQAMACGLPIVASRVMGVTNLVNGDNGLLFNAQDSMDLKKKLSLLLGDKNLRDSLGAKAYSYAKQNLSREKMFDRYNELVANT